MIKESWNLIGWEVHSTKSGTLKVLLLRVLNFAVGKKLYYAGIWFHDLIIAKHLTGI